MMEWPLRCCSIAGDVDSEDPEKVSGTRPGRATLGNAAAGPTSAARMRRLFSSVQRSERTLGCARSSSAAASTQPAVHAAKARSAPRRQRPHRAARPRSPAVRAIASPELRSPLRSSRGGRGRGGGRGNQPGAPRRSRSAEICSRFLKPTLPGHLYTFFSTFLPLRPSLSLLRRASPLPSFLDCRPLSSHYTCPFPGPHRTPSNL
uniref:Uncharacterized protein n=1 Tax=Mus musculus TaxID=10090 RepID=Q3UR76_MOUSE|nr:unnamed protein product [Mus musculus]